MAPNNLKISNPFQIGLLGGLGVLTALVIGGMFVSLANIITYVFAAIFLSLGLDPIVSKIEQWGLKRPLAIGLVLIGFIGVLALLVSSFIPQILRQAAQFVSQAPEDLRNIIAQPWVQSLDKRFDGAIVDAINNAGSFISNTANWPSVFGGVVQVGITLVNGFFGGIIITILTVYFMASLTKFKKWVYSLVRGSSRAQFESIAEQVAESVGRYVIGQAFIALCNGVLSFIFLSILGFKFALVLAFLNFLLSLIPLVGTLTGSIIVTVVALSMSPTTAIIAAVYYLIYMQVEAYLISPRVMSKAVAVPGAVVVVAALAGGTLLGVLGALVAIPVAASVMLILRQVVVPRQDSL
ncbi:MAG: AI-2E family transporter [Micrococcales bacterium]